jgi:hypothetical protein
MRDQVLRDLMAAVCAPSRCAAAWAECDLAQVALLGLTDNITPLI